MYLYISQSNFQYGCQLMYGSSWLNVSADYSSPSSIDCSLSTDAIPPLSATLSATLHLTLGVRILSQFPVSLYTCASQGSSCAACLSNSDIAPLCGWCVLSSGDTCATQLCGGTFMTSTCPIPQIASVSCKQQQQQQQQ